MDTFSNNTGHLSQIEQVNVSKFNHI